jgi:hypothetical protein
MNKNIYTKAMDSLKTSPDFVDKTMTFLQNSESKKEDTKPPLLSIRKWEIVITACAVVIVFAVFPLIQISDIPLKKSSDVTIKYVRKGPNIQSSALLVSLTEDEILGIDAHPNREDLRNTVILNGKVEDIQNIKIKMGRNENYRAILTLKTESCLKGSVATGSTINILLPCPIAINGFWQEDTGVISQVKVGMRGIFIVFPYDENDIWGEDGATLYLKELSEYGMGDGERFAFLDKEGKVVYDRQAFPSLPTAQSLEQVKEYIFNKINSR